VLLWQLQVISSCRSHLDPLSSHVGGWAWPWLGSRGAMGSGYLKQGKGVEIWA
jgi:hypothetical protein